jgi:pimeloyl-ACP methyl ester carboxylesterase
MATHVSGPLNWERLGKSGPPMAFVHPNPMDHGAWLYQMAHFSTWFQTIGIDLPGWGRSPAAEPGLTMPDVAEACWEAVDQVSPAPAVLVGLSVGSNVIQHMARLRPEQTAALVIAGAGSMPLKPKMFVRARQYEERGIAFRYEHTFEDFSATFRATPMARYFADVFCERDDSADVATIATLYRAFGAPDPERLSEDLRTPTLIISGSEDEARAMTLDLARRIPGAEVVTIEGAGHACNIEQPWEFDRHVAEFLQKRALLQRPPSGAATGGSR